MGLIPADAAIRSSAGVRWAMGATTAAVVAADQISKSLVLAAGPADNAGLGWVQVRLVRNTGTAGGLWPAHPVLVTLAALAVTAIAASFALRSQGKVAALCLAAVLGGAVGNLSDRLFRAPGFGRGGVVDWIHFGGSGGSMNLSDIAIQFGVIGAILAIVVGDRARKRREAGATGESRRAGEAGPAAEAREGRLPNHRRRNRPQSAARPPPPASS
ncbi:MAG TPA: signal peptidase II [Trebonia sp.]